MKFKKILLIALISLATITTYAQSDVVDIAVTSEDHTTLVAALKAANLVTTLKGEGPFTIFAPTNEAFDKLPAGTLESLLKPESKGTLSTILTNHVISGSFMASDVLAQIKADGGEFTIKTISGGVLIASIKDGSVVLTDAAGNTAKITATDLKGSNGIIHVIDGVLMPGN